MLSIVLFSPLGPQTGSGAVPRTPATPRHSPPLPECRDTPRDTLGRARDVLFYYYLVLQQICCHAFLEEQSWCSMDSSSFLIQHVYPIRLLEAAELLEADQRKHEGGHSKETSSKGF